ncbi:MAG: dual specificity protein phosphatase family protein [Anaerolineae bacterium]|nr:dual specificity protein phosphatase family protein [Anaerolineae bacterium]
MVELPPALPIDHITDGVYISGWRATQYADYLRQAEITNVLKLYRDIPHFPTDFNVLENAMDDGAFVPGELIKRGADFVVEQVDAGQRVLVMCGAGISRSSTFVLAYMVSRGHDLQEAFRLLRQKHPESTPHPQMWRSLIEHYQLSYTVKDALDWMRELR